MCIKIIIVLNFSIEYDISTKYLRLFCHQLTHNSTKWPIGQVWPSLQTFYQVSSLKAKLVGQ